MRLKLITFLLWLQDAIECLLQRYDRCSYRGCNEKAEYWCETGGHRHCPGHESSFYEDVNFCMACREQMTPEEIEELEREAEQDQPTYEEPFLP